MAKVCIVFLGAIALSLGVAHAETEDEVKAFQVVVKPILDECAKDFGITNEQRVAAKKAGNPDLLDPCYYECFFKKVGFIGANGLFDSDVAVQKYKKYFKGEADGDKVEKIGKACLSVNEEAVSEEKSCMRSKLLFTCFLREKFDFGIFKSQ